ncbi:MAG: hypothetical protein HKM95_12460 [Inquilinus sp.]|nr:hypothetical protein [Inquilinus sp.]
MSRDQAIAPPAAQDWAHDDDTGRRTPAFAVLGRDWSERAFLAAILLVVTYMAAANHFIQDDGFITLRYVDHWLRGHGPVWYPGSTEFGYTNFLFMVLVAALSATGRDPGVAANVVTYSGFFVSVAAAYLIAHRLSGGQIYAAGLAILVIFTNYSVSSYASGLLETSLQLALALLTYLWVLEHHRKPAAARYVYLAATTATLCLLTRLDSAVLLAPVGALLLYQVVSYRGVAKSSLLKHTSLAALIPLLALCSFFAFCIAQYGAILPNTFYAKADRELAFGLFYLEKFLSHENYVYVWAPIIMVAVAWRKGAAVSSTAADRGFAAVLMGTAFLWVGYVVFVGGGFMGYRLMVPFIALFYIRLISDIATTAGMRAAALISVAALIAHISEYTRDYEEELKTDVAIESPDILNYNVNRPHKNWQLVGRRLNALFYTGDPDDVLIATTAAGAIPYYSRLPTLDMHGLNTLEIARAGARATQRAGHTRKATIDQIRAAGVNLVLDHPTFICDDRSVSVAYNDPEQGLLHDMAVVLIPMLSGDCRLIAFYLHPHPRVEALLADGRLERFEGD